MTWPPDPLANPGAYRGVTLRRVFAYWLDLLILGGLLFLIYMALTLLVVASLGLAWPLYLLTPAVPLAYHALCTSGSAQATMGMRLLGLIAHRDDGPAPPSLGQALIHTLLLYLSLAILGGLPLLIALFNGRRRTPHDLLAGVLVLRRQGESRNMKL